MIEHIMVTTDGSALCTSALDQAKELAARLGCRVTVLHVRTNLEVPIAAGEGLPFDYAAEHDRHCQNCDEVVRRAVAYLDGVQASGYVARAEGRAVADVIVREADEQDVDLIVMSTHCRTGLRRLLSGSVAETVLHHARQPVLLTHDISQAPTRRAPRHDASAPRPNLR